MPSIRPWKSLYQIEIDHAHSARQLGNEGMARVCARRAVGILLGEYLLRRGLSSPGPSAYDRLRIFQALPDLTPDILEVSSHFLLRVSSDHTLPGDPDLIAEAEWLAEVLLPE